MEPPPLPPPNMTLVEESAIVGSTGPASGSTGPASSSTGPAMGGPEHADEVSTGHAIGGPDPASKGTAAAEVPEASFTMDDIFNAAFPE